MPDQIPDKMPDVTCSTTLKPQAQVLQVSGFGVDRIPRTQHREHHLVQLHVGHTAANAGEVLHDEGHVCAPPREHDRTKDEFGDRRTWWTSGWENSSWLSWCYVDCTRLFYGDVPHNAWQGKLSQFLIIQGAAKLLSGEESSGIARTFFVFLISDTFFMK